jgi:ankyrin repeat protein
MNREAAANFIQVELNSRLWNLFSAANAHGSTDTNIKEQATILFNAGAQINHLHTDDDHNAWSISHLVSQLGSLGLIKFLHGYSDPADLRLCNGDGSIPLHLAAANGHFSLVTHYRELGYNLNSVNNEGDTALHYASMNKHFRVVRYLVLWGSQYELKNRTGQTALDLARAATTDSSDEELILKQLVHFLEKLDFASQGLREESSSAVSSTPVDLSTVDVCVMSVAAVVPALKHVGAEDEDPAGSISKGMLQGKPNSNLRSAVKKGQLSEAKAAIAEGADIRHIENGKSPLQEVRLAKEDNKQKASRADNHSARSKYTAAVSSCQFLEDALIEIATAKMIEAITQGNEGRVAAYFNVGAVITPKCVHLTVTSSDNVAIIDFLVSKSIDCYNCLTDYTSHESPYVSACNANNMKVAQYIFSRLSTDLVKAVSENNLSRVQRLVRSGASVDSAGVQNIVVAVQHGNLEMVRLLCDNGCRFPQEWLDAATELSIQLGSLKPTAEIQFYLQYKILNRMLRLAAASGDFQTVKRMHNLGGDINAKNVYGSTALTLSVQYLNAEFVRVCHLLVSVGARMLHSDSRVKTLIHLAKVNKSKILEEYLSRELDGQFLASIQDGDLANAHSFAELGADFNAVDEQGRTALHYAVLLHGVDIVSWLCERGALLNIADLQGEYPITLAAMKGDYSSVEFIVKFNAGTKQLKNSAGFTALDLAKRSHYNRLVQLLDPGNPDFLVNEEDENIAPPKYNLSTLVLAAKNGQFQVCQEFIDQRYASLTMKTDICRRMIEAAESKNQAQILAILKPHYKSLSSTAASDQTAERLVSASAQQKAILSGFLVSMSNLLGAGDVSLDVNDPATYSQLFSNLNVRVKNRTEQLAKSSGDESGVQKIYQQDTLELQQKVMKLSEQMAKMNDSRTSLTKRLQAAEAQLAACKTAKDKKNVYAELQETKDQLLTLQASASLFVNAQKTANHKKKVLDSLKANTQLLCFYQSVENRLQGLFTACKAATAGMFVDQASENAQIMTLGVELVGQVVTIVPVIGSAIQTVLVPVVSALISHLDKSRQKQEVRNITTLGNVEELDKAASNAAGLLTLYYHSQINAIDMRTKIKSKENPVVLAAEYAITWMIDALKAGEFVPGLPLADQLWFSVASRNPFDKKTIANRLGFGGPGAVTISLKVGVSVTLKNFYGCVAVAAENGSIYSVEADPADKQDMTIYGMTYLSAFANASMVDKILRKRQLKLGASNERSAVVPSQLVEQISAFQTSAEVDQVTGAVSLSSSGSVTAYEVKDIDQKYTAHSIAAELRQDGAIISEQQVRDLLAQQRSEMEVMYESSIAEVKDEAQEKANYYQATADAAAEQAAKDLATLRKDAETYKRQLQDTYAAALREQTAELMRRQDILLQQQKEMFTEKEEKLTATVNELQKVLESTVKLLSDRLESTTNEALAKASKAVASSNEAVALSQSLQTKTNETLVQTGLLVESAETKINEAKAMIESTARTAEAAINEAKATNAAALTKLQTKYTADLEKIRTAAEASSAAAKESAAAARETSNASKEATRANKDQLALLQKELRDNAKAMKVLERP